ncbi:filaggrin [Strongylocentrotus purpuratus]|uniref:Coiled-coil SMC6 And NSE5 INteracting (CANIN) domain-containing protein n=1 Tax=Strongylocentrotus purpuratus TaxID=7668 RepID=A0A7M7NX95_STRPU|nr:filaggrin [Strongylocentrotus purpuratus]
MSMDSSGRQPPTERVGEKILQETHQNNRLPHASSNPKRPSSASGSDGKGTHLPYSHGEQRQPHQSSMSKSSFGACLNSVHDRSARGVQGSPVQGFSLKRAVMKSTTSQACSSSSPVKPSIPRLKGQPLTSPGKHYHSSPAEHETTGRRKIVNTTHTYKRGEMSLKTPPRGQNRESSSTPKSKDRSSSQPILSSERGKSMHLNYRSPASIHAKSVTEQGEHSRSHSQSRHRTEPGSSVDTVRDGFKSRHSSNPKGRHHSESSSIFHKGDTGKDREQSHVSQERSRHQSECSAKHHHGHPVKDREKSQERSRHRSGTSSKTNEVDTVKGNRKSQSVPQPRSRHQSESNVRHGKVDAVSDRKKTHEAKRQRSHSESSRIMDGVTHEEKILASKKKHTMLWVLNSTPSEEDEQLTSSKPVKQKTHDQTLSPNTDHARASFIIVQDKAGWAKRIYSDGSSGVTSGMEPVGRSSYSSVDSSGCQKRHGGGSRDLHLKKRKKLQRKNSSPSSSHQGVPSYGALLNMAQRNLSNGQHTPDGKITDRVPERIRRNSHQSGSDSEQHLSRRNLQQGSFECDYDEEKVKRLFKASLSATPKKQKQKLSKQSSVDSHASLESCGNPSSSNSMDEISLEKVERLFNASLNTKSKTTESPKVESKAEPKAAKCPLEEAQSPERPQYTCTFKGRESSSEQSDKHITLSFRKVHHLSKKSLGSHHLHKFREKSVKGLRLEASSRAVHIPLKRLKLKSESIFLTEDVLRRLGRSSSFIVNTARKHNFLQGKKQKAHKHKPRRRAFPLCSSSDPETTSVSNSHAAPLQYDIPLRHAMSDSAALSESSVSSGVASGVANLFQELSSDPSRTDQPGDSSSPLGLHGRSKVTASPKFSGSISKLKRRIGKRLQAAVQGDRPGCSNNGNESDSTLFGSSAGEGYPFGDTNYIPGVEDVIFEETVATEEYPQMDTLAECMVSESSEGCPSPANAKHTVLLSQPDPCDLMPGHSENSPAEDGCDGSKATETSGGDGNVASNEEQLLERDLPTISVMGNDQPGRVPQTCLKSNKSENTCPQPKGEAPVLRDSEHPPSSPLHETKAREDQQNGEVLEDTLDPAGEPEEGSSDEDLDDSESLPDACMNAGDFKDTQESSSDSTDGSQPANTPTTLMKEVCRIGNVPVPGTPSKPYPFPLNDSLSPGRLSQEMSTEETTTKKRKLRFSLAKMVDMKKKTKFEATFERLKQDVSQGGFARQMEEQQETGDGDHDNGSDEPEENQAILERYGVSEEQKIPKVHPGEDIFDQTKLRQIFNYNDHMASLAGCGFKPDKPSALESLMLKATPDEMVEMLRTFAVEMAYHSKPCPPAFMLWLFRLMSVHTDCNVVNKAYQTMWSILNSWPIQHPAVVPWAPSVAEITQILVNYGASFNDLLPPGLVNPEFDENSIRPPMGEDKSGQQKERVQPSAADLTDPVKARYHGNNLMKVIKILTLALITRKTVDRFPYTEEEVSCLAVLVCKASLEKYFIMKAVENDFTLCLLALFECVPEPSWEAQAERLCHVLPHVAAHHHNLVYITHLIPGCTERGRYMSRQLAYMCLKKLSPTEPEQNNNGFHPELKVQYILDVVPATRPSKDTDYYKLHSRIQILDLAIGNERLDKSEKESLQSLNNKLNVFVKNIREKVSNISRSQVKDLIGRMTLRLTLMDQSIVSDQVNIFNRMLPLTGIKEENIEEHFPQSQEDAVSTSSEEEGEDKSDDMDEDDEEEGEDHAPADVGHSPEKT